MSIYKPKQAYFAFPGVQAIVALALFGAGLANASIFVLVPIPIVLGIPPMLRYRPIQVSVDDTLLGVTHTNGFGRIKMQQYPLNTIDFIYRYLPISGGRGGARRGNILSIYHGEALIADLAPLEEGWVDGDIRLLASELTRRGVKQVIDKFGDKDVKIS